MSLAGRLARLEASMVARDRFVLLVEAASADGASLEEAARAAGFDPATLPLGTILAPASSDALLAELTPNEFARGPKPGFQAFGRWMERYGDRRQLSRNGEGDLVASEATILQRFTSEISASPKSRGMPEPQEPGQ